MSRPGLFDVLTLGVFWRMDRRQEEEIRRDEELKLKEREVKALEKLAKQKEHKQ